MKKIRLVLETEEQALGCYQYVRKAKPEPNRSNVYSLVVNGKLHSIVYWSRVVKDWLMSDAKIYVNE